MTDVPEPKESGSAGAQREGAKQTSLEVLPPTHGLSIAETIDGLAVSRPRALGNDAAARLLAASFTKLDNDVASLNDRIYDKDEEIKVLRENLMNAKVEIATLRSSIQTAKKSARLRQFGIFGGTVIMGVAVDLYKANVPNAPAILLVVGLVTVGLSWWTPGGGGAE